MNKSAYQLKAWIRDSGMSQEQFAKKVDVSRPTLSRFINGHLLPCVDTAIAIEKVTNGAVSVGGWVIEAKVTFAA